MPRIMLGQLFWTRGINTRLAEDEGFSRFVWNSIKRHRKGDWGNVCKEDFELNDQALIEGTRILSSYSNGETEIWIITEADRSYTTILFPEEY